MKIQGFCPACGRDTLFLGSGGYVTCGWIDEREPCPDPGAAADLLDAARETQHLVQFEADTFSVQHPLFERLNGDLWACDVHKRIAALDGPPVALGRYRLQIIDGRMHWQSADDQRAQR